ncbi:MAG: helix-turn-helix transcriptional regulator [Acidothermales bacterium]|nr:helix-turn-helix transcriptional regulator [Acidothermales bacterium]
MSEEHEERGRRHGSRRRGPRGGLPPMPPVPPGFGPRPGFGPGPGFDPRGFGPRGFGRRGFRKARARRGDVRAGVLALLGERPMNGYQVIQELRERSAGYWRPSPGSVYPALQQLEDEGLVRTTEVDGRKAYELTDEGREHVDSRPEAYDAPWDSVSGDIDDDVQELTALGAQLSWAAIQVTQAGTTAQLQQAKQVLADARRALYRILAEDDPEESATADEPGADDEDAED